MTDEFVEHIGDTHSIFDTYIIMIQGKIDLSTIVHAYTLTAYEQK